MEGTVTISTKEFLEMRESHDEYTQLLNDLRNKADSDYKTLVIMEGFGVQATVLTDEEAVFELSKKLKVINENKRVHLDNLIQKINRENVSFRGFVRLKKRRLIADLRKAFLNI